MFKKQRTIEEDFMQYNGDALLKESQKKETNILTTIIRILTIFVLLGVLVIGSIFGYKYLKEGNKQLPQTLQPTKQQTPIATPQPNTHQKMYTQAQMQDIMQLVIKNMQKQQQEQSTQKTATKKANSIQSEEDFISLLKKEETDNLQKLEANEVVDKTVSTKKITQQKSHISTDTYNKVVLNKAPNSYDSNVNNLSMQIEHIVQEMKDKKYQQNSNYTEEIKKEVHIRENAMRIIIVRAGDTLSKIARRAYGSAMAYDKILNENPDLIKNPNHIYIGQRLRVPLN